MTAEADRSGWLIIDKPAGITSSRVVLQLRRATGNRYRILRRLQDHHKTTLVVDAASNENLKLSAKNCKDHQFLPPEGVNVYDLLRHDTLVLSQDAAKALEARCLKKGAEK